MQYAQNHHRSIAQAATSISTGYPATTMANLQFHVHEISSSGHGTSQIGNKHTLINGHSRLQNAETTTAMAAGFLDQSPSPPQSSISSDFHSQSSVEFPGDSGSPNDHFSSSQSNFSNQAVCSTHVAVEGYVATPDSNYGYYPSAQAVDVQGFDANNNVNNLKDGRSNYTLEQLENVLFASDEEDEDTPEDDKSLSWMTDLLDDLPCNTLNMQNLALSDSHNENAHMTQGSTPTMMPMSHDAQVQTLLLKSAKAIDEERYDIAQSLLADLRQEVSVLGSPVERLAAYMAEGLVARLQASGFSIYHFLNCTEAPAPQVLSAMQKLYEICPYIKFAYIATYGAMAEAFKDESKIHIFDFRIAQGTQWIPLIQSLGTRPGGPPSLRISTIEDKGSQGSPIGGMQLVKEKLSSVAASLNVPFELSLVECKVSEFRADMLEKREGETLAVNFTLQLHHLPDESVSVTNPRDRMIREMKSLQPKVFTLVEQEANTNTTPFFPRFVDTLKCYTAMFESIEAALPRDSKDRVNVEEQCLARDIVNLIACEGTERVERHELMGKWRARMTMAGFQPRPLSSNVNNTIKALLGSYNQNYILKEEGGALFLGWKNRFIVTASAWH